MRFYSLDKTIYSVSNCRGVDVQLIIQNKNILKILLLIIVQWQLNIVILQEFYVATAVLALFCIGRNSLNSAGNSSSEYNLSEK